VPPDTHRYAGYLLLADPEALARYERRLPGLQEPPVVALARAVAASPGWPDGSDAVLMAHTGPQPRLIALGRFDRAGEDWLRCQAHALHHACGHLRYVGYPQVERDCERLADMLREELGKDLTQAKFLAIPRGGFVVLSLLATLLDLDPEQMAPSCPPCPENRPLVVVDDCALSGVRFSQFLRGQDSSRIVFAPLCSPPELRSAIESREPRVERVLSAADVGAAEALAFPWNEPDRAVWNPAAERWETAWRIVPPELCLKNRVARPIPVQVHPIS
jgi:hypothetical protein